MDHGSNICHQFLEISAAQKIELSMTTGKRARAPSLLFGFSLPV
jgi:hypothetical protein